MKRRHVGPSPPPALTWASQPQHSFCYSPTHPPSLKGSPQEVNPPAPHPPVTHHARDDGCQQQGGLPLTGWPPIGGGGHQWNGQEETAEALPGCRPRGVCRLGHRGRPVTRCAPHPSVLPEDPERSRSFQEGKLPSPLGGPSDSVDSLTSSTRGSRSHPQPTFCNQRTGPTRRTEVSCLANQAGRGGARVLLRADLNRCTASVCKAEPGLTPSLLSLLRNLRVLRKDLPRKYLCRFKGASPKAVANGSRGQVRQLHTGLERRPALRREPGQIQDRSPFPSHLRPDPYSQWQGGDCRPRSSTRGPGNVGTVSHLERHLG